MTSLPNPIYDLWCLRVILISLIYPNHGEDYQRLRRLLSCSYLLTTNIELRVRVRQHLLDNAPNGSWEIISIADIIEKCDSILLAKIFGWDPESESINNDG